MIRLEYNPFQHIPIHRYHLHMQPMHYYLALQYAVNRTLRRLKTRWYIEVHRNCRGWVNERTHKWVVIVDVCDRRWIWNITGRETGNRCVSDQSFCALFQRVHGLVCITCVKGQANNRQEHAPSISSSGSRPKSVGVDTMPETRALLSTKSIIRQSVLPVFGESLIPRPICRVS